MITSVEKFTNEPHLDNHTSDTHCISTQRSTHNHYQKRNQTHFPFYSSTKLPQKRNLSNFIPPSIIPNASSTMLTVAQTAPNPVNEPTIRDLAYQAASNTKLNSFANAYGANPTQALCIANTFSKDYPADTRLANLCDSGLVNQMAFLMEMPTGPASLAVLSCLFPTAKGTEAVFAGSLGDTMDVICPVTIRMRDIKGQCITIAAVKSTPTVLNVAISASDPIAEEAPAAVEGAPVIPPGPDRLGLEINDPNDAPCITLFPKNFPLAGGYSIPTGEMIDVASIETLRDLPGAPDLDEFHLWYESMRYGATTLQNWSVAPSS